MTNPHKPDPYAVFKDDQLRLLALENLERHRTLRQLVITAGATLGALVSLAIFLLKTGTLTTC